MKVKIENYSFNKTSKTIVFLDYVTIRLDAVLIVVNTTSNIVIYNFADPTKGGSVNTNILLLDYDTTSMSNTDKLLIYYDDIVAEQLVNVSNFPANYPLPTSQADIFTDGSQKTQVVGGDGSVLNVVDRSQTPSEKVINVQVGPGDIISNIPVVIDYEHHQVHEGETWMWHIFTALNSATYNIRISVPTLDATTKTPHLVPEVVSDTTSTRLYLYEGTTWTSGGTDDSSNIYNRNRNIVGSPNTKIYINGGTALTPNALGTEIWSGYLFTGAKGSLSTDRQGNEWVLKSNTEYLFRATTTGNGSVMIRLMWYEDLGV